MGIKKISELAQVSTATVSRVLNNPQLVKKETRDKVLKIAKELEYKKYNSRFSFENKKDEIAVIIPDLRNTFFAKIVEGVMIQAKIDNLPVNLYLTHDNIKDELESIEELIEKEVKGVILVRSRNKEKETLISLKKLDKFSIPFIIVDRDISVLNCSGIFLSNTSAVYDAITLLIKDKYSKIAILSGPENSINSNRRIDGYKEALIKNGIFVNEELIHIGEFTIQSGFDMTINILNSKIMPDAIFTSAIQLTIGCLKAISQKGLILGKDIKVFSFNKVDATFIDNFDLSYIEHPAESMGKKSVVMLKNKLRGTKDIMREILDYKIVYKNRTL